MIHVDIMLYIINSFDQSNNSVVHRFAQQWNCTKGTLNLISVSANAIFSFTSQDFDFILRITYERNKVSSKFDWRERNEQLLLGEIEYLQYLHSLGIPVNVPVKSRNNSFVEKLTNEKGIFYAVVFEKVNGKIIELGDMSESQIFQWGKTMG